MLLETIRGPRDLSRLDREQLRDLASEIEWAKASLVSPDDYPAVTARAQPGPGPGPNPTQP